MKVRLGGISYVGDVLLRWRILPSGVDLRHAAKRVFVAPADAELTLWITQSCVVAEGLLPMELQLERAPKDVIAVMEELVAVLCNLDSRVRLLIMARRTLHVRYGHSNKKPSAQDLDDLRIAREGLRQWREHPETALTVEEVKIRYGIKS